MLWAYDWPGIKGEHMKLNPFIKEATGSGEADRRTRGWGWGGWGGLVGQHRGLRCHQV